MDKTATKEISYASSAKGRGGRTLIRLLENATGRPKLLRRVQGYDAQVGQGGDLWDVLSDRFGLSVDVIGGALGHIPQTGPLVVVANHPYGILDGLTLGRMLSQRRGGDFRILANSVFNRAEDMNRFILPISFDDTRAAAAQNIATRRTALDYLAGGGAIGVFPGGTVSTSASPLSQPLDPVWRNFTAKMIAATGATVVPVFFDGANSRLFQVASHLNTYLRLGLLIREFCTKVDRPVRVVIGKPIDPAKLDALRHNPKACMDFLRHQTYALSPRPIDANKLGHEFEAKHRVRHGGGNFRQRFGRLDRL
ncbi:MAG: putative hemolysin [Loktanella salsilacus]|jgi:putative hemolysin|uniref:lysophospholipid acyltransferase family protein n=1 Tax=Loktanella salsilacus TaxID=195913 RepID=UPI003989F542